MHYFSKNDILLYQINNINKIILSFFYFIVFFFLFVLSTRLGIQYLQLRLGSKLSLGLIYYLRFRIQTASYFPQSWVKKKNILIFYLADFHGRDWCIQGFHEKRFYNLHLSLFSYYFSLEMRLVRSKSKITK